MSAREEFERRFLKYADRYVLSPSSYQTHDGEGNAGGWIARVTVIENSSGEKSAAYLYSDTSRRYASEDESDFAAMWLGLQWLDENA